jgi:hypothetical protein
MTCDACFVLQVRAAVIELLDAWASVAPLEPLVSELSAALASPKASADARKEGLAWLLALIAGAHCSGGGLV